MKLLRIAIALLVVAVGVVVGAPPALAGNWVVTVMDPVPDRFEAGRGYTIGFWALQHGSHPYEGTFEAIGLKLVDAKGSPRVFPATALPEAAHYATTVFVPTSGTWTVYGVHEPFQDYKIGTLTVPGGLNVLGVPEPSQAVPVGPWGDIRPPAVPVDHNRGPFDDGTTTIVAPQVPSTDAAAARPASTERGPAPAVLAILAATTLLLGLVFAQRRRRRTAPPPVPVADRLDLQVEEAIDVEPAELRTRP